MPDTRIFILRLVTDPGFQVEPLTNLRGSIQPLGDTPPLFFKNSDQLVNFLYTLAQSSPADGQIDDLLDQ